MKCPFCGGEAVDRPRMEHRTVRYEKRSHPSKLDVHMPRRRFICTACRRVFAKGAD